MVKISAFASVIKILYSDILIVKRSTQSTDEYGATQDGPDETVYSNQPCRLSFGSKSEASTDTLPAANKKDATYKIICSPSLLILKGDRIIVNRKDDRGNIMTVYNGIAGLPQKFPSHQEVALTISGEA
jgi:hypothetical protein